MKYPTQRFRSTRAFTLFEVAIAAVVMVAGLVGMMQAVINGSEMLDTARKQTIAVQIIDGAIDQVRAANWTQISAMPATSTVAPNADLQAITGGFQCTRTISTVQTGLKQIIFTVTWTGNTGRTHARSSTTFVTQNGLNVSYQKS